MRSPAMKNPDPKETAEKQREEPLKERDEPPVAVSRSDATREEIDQLREKQGDFEDAEELPLKEQS